MLLEGLAFLGAYLFLKGGKKGSGSNGESFGEMADVDTSRTGYIDDAGNVYPSDSGDTSSAVTIPLANPTQPLSYKQQLLLQAADQVVAAQTKAANCFDFVHRIFSRAGYGGTSSNEAADLDFIWIGNQYSNTYKTRTIQPRMSMEDWELDQLQPGDWLYIHNSNSYDTKGNHSVFFYGWVDQANRIAKTAEQGLPSRPGVFSQRDFRKHQVVHVMRVKP